MIMQPAFTVHIDLPDPGIVSTLTGLIGDLGGGVLTASSSDREIDILLTERERVQPRQGTRESLLESPTILLWSESTRWDPHDLLRNRIFGIVGPGSDGDELRDLLQDALEDRRSRLRLVSEYEDVRDRYIELATVVRLNLELELELNVDEVLDKIVRQISGELGFSIISIMLLDRSEKFLRIRASKGLGEEVLASAKVEVGKGIAGWVAKTGEPLLVRDIESHPTLKKLQSHGRYTSKSLICVPLKVGERIIGVLNGNNRVGRQELNEHDLRLLSVYASQVSMKIERARLYRDLKRQADKLKTAYDRLQALDNIKSDFITNVSHEFRTPITVILGYLELLKAGLSGEGQINKVNIAMKAAYRLARLVDDSTDILRLDSDTMPFSFTQVSIPDFVGSLAQRYSTLFAEKGVTLTVDLPKDLPRVFLDTGKMNKVFDKLMDNSLKFTPKGGRATLSCSMPNEGEVRFAMEDTGPGIPFGERERVFERFEQGGDIMTSKPEGTGLGLPIARAIIERHGGRLWIDGKYRDGCRILFTLSSGKKKDTPG